MKVRDVITLFEAINAIKFIGLKKEDIHALLHNLRQSKAIATEFDTMREVLVEKCKPDGYDDLDNWIREHAGEKITVEIREKVNKHHDLAKQYNDAVRSQIDQRMDEDSGFDPLSITPDGFDMIIDQECNREVAPSLLLALSNLVKMEE